MHGELAKNTMFRVQTSLANFGGNLDLELLASIVLAQSVTNHHAAQRLPIRDEGSDSQQPAPRLALLSTIAHRPQGRLAKPTRQLQGPLSLQPLRLIEWHHMRATGTAPAVLARRR